MTPEECTLVIGIDALHLRELRLTWPTWMLFKPELRRMPLIIFYDASQVDPKQVSFVEADHPNVRWVAWDLPNAFTQREKMISGFVHVPARYVDTPWYLKLDTDAVATAEGAWIEAEWFRPNAEGVSPVFVSARWGYSKPRYVIELLDDWADKIPGLSEFPRLNLPYKSEGKSRVYHKRIISWLFFGDTAWTKRVAGWLPTDGRLPWASQDTFLSYCAIRSRQHWVRVPMRHYGWSHGRLRSLQRNQRLVVAQRTAQPPLAPQNVKSPKCGVVYYNIGLACAARLLVSISSLRRFYSGPVTILSEGDASYGLSQRIANEFGAEIIAWNCGVPPGANRVYLAKANYHQGTPYDVTIAIDSDTLIVGPIEELFATAETSSFCVSQLAGWRSSGSIIGKRIRAWSKWLPNDIEPAINFGPAINCGVVAFRKDAPLYQHWLKLSLLGRESFIPEEVCCQIILHRFPHQVLDGRWNCSCKHDNPDRPDTRIIHYHGRKHCRIGLPYKGEKWVAEFERLCYENVAGIQEWAPADDRTLRRWLHDRERRGR